MAAVIVHGGAYAIPDSIAEDSLAGCREASECSYEALMNGKSAVEAGIDFAKCVCNPLPINVLRGA